MTEVMESMKLSFNAARKPACKVVKAERGRRGFGHRDGSNDCSRGAGVGTGSGRIGSAPWMRRRVVRKRSHGGCVGCVHVQGVAPSTCLVKARSTSPGIFDLMVSRVIWGGL